MFRQTTALLPSFPAQRKHLVNEKMAHIARTVLKIIRRLQFCYYF